MRHRLGSPLVQALLDGVACLVVILDREGRILLGNQACRLVTGVPLEEVEGRRAWEVLASPENQQAVRLGLERLWQRRGPCSLELETPRDSGGVARVAWSARILRDAEAGLEYVLATGVDVSGLRSTQEELGEAHHRLRVVMESLIRAQEDERRRVAYDVHDGLLQFIVGAQMHLAALDSLLAAGQPGVREELARVRERISQAVSEGRRIIAALRPSTLDDYGLVETLRRELRALRKEGWHASFHAQLDRPLPPHLEMNLYRIFQEALHNVVKHAQARRLRVDLAEAAGRIRLRVRDWGQGFQAGATPPGMGLRTLRERAEIFGGDCRVTSVPGEGTTVEVTIPAARQT